VALSADLLATLDDYYRPETIGALYREWLAPIHKKEAAWLDEETAAWLTPPPGRATPAEPIVILALVYAYRDLFTRLRNALPPEVGQTFFWLVWHGPHTLDALAQRLGKMPFPLAEGPVSDQAQRVPVAWRFFFVETVCHGGRENIQLWFPESIRRLIRPHLEKPRGYDLEGASNSPETAFTFRETEPGRFLARCLAFAASGSVRLNKNTRRLTLRSVRQFNRHVGCRPFFPQDAGKPAHFRANLILLFLAHAGVDAETMAAAEAERQWQNLMKAYFRGSDAFNLAVLSHLGGRGANLTRAKDCGAMTARSAQTLLRHLPDARWLSMEDLLDFLRFRDLPVRAFQPGPPWPSVFANLASTAPGDRRPRRLFVDGGNHESLVAVPLLQAHLFLLAGLGILEAAYDPPKHAKYRRPDAPWLTPYDGLRAVRLTEWGAAVLAEDALARPPEGASRARFEAHAFIVTLNNSDDRMDAFLKQMGRPLGSRQIAMDFDSFLQGLDNKNGLRSRIQLIRRTIAATPPVNWEAFFQTMTHRSESLVHDSDWLVFKIEDSPEGDLLTKLLAVETDLRPLVTFAEGRRVLVLPGDFPTLKKKLKRHGFLLST